MKNTIEITKEEFNSNQNHYLEMIENCAVKKIIIQGDTKESFIVTSYEEHFNNEKRRCCSNESDKWETIGFSLFAIVVIISLNFGNK